MFRIIWQYESETVGDFDSEALRSTEELLSPHRNTFSDLELLGEPEAVFPESNISIRAATLAATPTVADDPVCDLAGYHHAFAVTREEAEKLVERLQNTSGVAQAEIQGCPTQPLMFTETRKAATPDTLRVAASLNPAPTRDLTSYQGYLDPAPGGIDARFAWSLPGGRGGGVRIVDIEAGWNFSHEDLRRLQCGVIFGPNEDNDHGTAVLGIFSADSNGQGVEGIASQALAFAASANYGDRVSDPVSGLRMRKWNAARAIYNAAARLRSGDVILLEMHGPGPRSSGIGSSQQGFLPIEYWNCEFAAIRHAVNRGIHVVEAAGNGGEDLDLADYGGRFDRSRRDSGAILVGGGASALDTYPRSRMDWSNYGGRLDVQGWGEDIATTGGKSSPRYHDLIAHDDASRCYTASFGGTSGASPIVVGVVASVTGALRAAGRPPLDPAATRDLLRDTGTPQADGPSFPATERIGPLPNLRAIFESLGLG